MHAMSTPRHALCPTTIAAALLIVLLFPPVRHGLEASMLAQMLAQIPLLAATGWLFGARIPPAVRARLAAWNANGVTSLVVASLCGMGWMLPRALDAAAESPLVDAAKYVSVPLLIGVPLALGWSRASFVVRGVFLAEVVASLFRVGWLYRVSPIRLCNAYPLADQRMLGLAMMALGATLVGFIGLKLLFGRLRPIPPASITGTGIIG